MNASKPLRDRAARNWPVAALVTALMSGSVPAQTTVRVSTGPTGFQGNFNSLFGAPSADGRYVAFQSFASNLVASDANIHVPDIFVKDIQTGDTTLVSVSSAGIQGGLGSFAPSISGDGRWVAFESDASNFVAGDTNLARDIFVRDRQSGTTTLVSSTFSGLPADGASGYATISLDGAWVAFESDATNIVNGDTNGLRDVFRVDRAGGAVVRASTSTSGAEANGISFAPTISADGRWLAFTSDASNLVLNDTNGASDVFVKDMATGSIVRASVSTSGLQGDGPSVAPAISGDGRWIAFASSATNLVPNDTNLASDVFLHDMQTGVTVRASLASSGAEANGASVLESSYLLSFDGRFVAFDSTATNLVVGDTNGAADCFVHDRLTGLTNRVDLSWTGAQSASAVRATAITPDGRRVVFESPASNLVAGDNNLYWDVFLRDRGSIEVLSYCFGDGSSAACPCGNTGGAGRGCANSSNPTGASLGWSGTPSIAADTLVLDGSGMPDAAALFFQGTAHVDAVFGDGKRCAAGTVIRLKTQTNSAGSSQYPSAGDVPVSVRGACTSGDQRLYQVWYRNADPTFCTPSTFNLTNALAVTWGP